MPIAWRLERTAHEYLRHLAHQWIRTWFIVVMSSWLWMISAPLAEQAFLYGVHNSFSTRGHRQDIVDLLKRPACVMTAPLPGALPLSGGIRHSVRVFGDEVLQDALSVRGCRSARPIHEQRPQRHDCA